MKRYKQELFEMSNFFPNTTGLDYTIWVSTKSGKEKHWARIKISNTDGEASISISDNPEIKDKKGKIKINSTSFNKIKKFIKMNQQVLLDHWNGLIDSKELSQKLIFLK
jgi:hypothetical protein